VEAVRKSPDDKYVQSVTLNGKPYDEAWFPHSAVAQGGKLVFQMGSQPNLQFAAAEAAAPPSMTK
jgi:putative alpha-1,2-mannosidase